MNDFYGISENSNVSERNVDKNNENMDNLRCFQSASSESYSGVIIGGDSGSDNLSEYSMFNNQSEGYNPEKAMWRAVILQAFSDACSRSNRTSEVVERNKARNWLLGNSESLTNACDYAGFSPDFIRKEAQKAIDSGYLMCEIAKIGAKEIRKRKANIPDRIKRTRRKKAFNQAQLIETKALCMAC